MSYRFIALVDVTGRGSVTPVGDTEARLRETNMRECVRTDSVALYVSDDTPVLPLSGRDIVIGHLFSRSGVLTTSAAQLPRHSGGAELRRYILENCWGTYLLFQPATEHGNSLDITRDPEGGIPCLYSLENGTGFVTSDIGLPVGLDLYRKYVDWNHILHRLIYPDIKTARTGLAGIRELLPGMRLALHGPTISTHAEWSPWSFVGKEQRHSTLDEAAGAVRRSIDMAVKAWAEVDTSVLLELSGGLDSSIVGACLRGSAARVVCCTLVTPVPGADERHYASQIAELIATELDAQTLCFEYGKYDFDQKPQSATPRVGMLQHATDTLMERARRRHGATSFFSGGGGDTVFCYLSTAAPAADAFLAGGLTTALRTVSNLAQLHQCTLWKAGRLTLSKLVRPPASPYKAVRQFLNPDARCVPEPHPWFEAPDAALPGERERIFALATTQVYRDAAPRGLIRPLRLPLLSQPVMEAALRAPSWMWFSGSRNRVVARQAFADVLPVDVLNRQSKGSFSGYVSALYARHRYQMRDYLLNGHLQSQGILDARALGRFIDGNLAPRDRSFGRVLELCMVENWVRHQR